MCVRGIAGSASKQLDLAEIHHAGFLPSLPSRVSEDADVDDTYDGVVPRSGGPDITLHLPRPRRIYTTPPIRINCAGRRRKYAAKDIEARYYDANERPERPDGAPRGVQRMLKTLSRDEGLETCRRSVFDDESAPNRSMFESMR